MLSEHWLRREGSVNERLPKKYMFHEEQCNERLENSQSTESTTSLNHEVADHL